MAQIRRRARDENRAEWPCPFLSDPDMIDNWQTLRAHIEDSARMDAVVVAMQSATAVFDHFIACTRMAHDPQL